MGEPTKRKARKPKKRTESTDQLLKLARLQTQIFKVVEGRIKHAIIADLLAHELGKATGQKRATLKLEAAEQAAEKWLDNVRDQARRIAVKSGQIGPNDYHAILSGRMRFGDLPGPLPDFRGRRSVSRQVDQKKVRLRYQELLSHLKARPAKTPEDLQRLVPGLSSSQAAELVGQNDYRIAATLAAKEFKITPATVLSKTKGIPMEVGNELGLWQLDSKGRCTFRPFIEGGKDLGKPVRVRGIGQLPR